MHPCIIHKHWHIKMVIIFRGVLQVALYVILELHNLLSLELRLTFLKRFLLLLIITAAKWQIFRPIFVSMFLTIITFLTHCIVLYDVSLVLMLR